VGRSEVILGIDLGTSFSTAAAVIDGKLHFALDSRGEACFPTVVHFPKVGAPIVGHEADRHREQDPAHTFFGFKRVIGRTAESPAAKVLDASAPFKLVLKPTQEVAVKARAAAVTATELAAIVLRHLKDRATQRFCREVTKVVLTVPTLSTAATRAAMVKAAQRAGLEVVRLVQEPVAGAVAHGANPKAPPFLVYDFGGGTFDAAVVRGNGAGLELLASGGDDCLGGDDFDLAFSRYIANGLWKIRRLDAQRDAELWTRITRQCEQVKRALSNAPQVRYQLKDAFRDLQPDLDLAVTRDNLAPSWAELVKRSLDATGDTIEQSGVERSQLAGALLIGGTTFVHQVRAAVHGMFGGKVLLEKDPQTAVARGAAIIAANPDVAGPDVFAPAA
jgi:molecular chaperone DnaK (HSP70)